MLGSDVGPDDGVGAGDCVAPVGDGPAVSVEVGEAPSEGDEEANGRSVDTRSFYHRDM